MAKKKHFALLCALLCASMMAFATAQDTYLGCDGGLEAYANKYKWYSLDGATAPNEVVSIQRPAWDGLVECGIYVNVGVDYDGVKYNGSAVTTAEYCYRQGTGGILYISKFVNKCTTVEFTNGGSVVRGLRIQYDGGTGDACESGGGGGSFDPASIDWNNVDFITGQSQYKIYFTEENRPNNWETINIQTAAWAENHTGIYVTTVDGVSACTLVDKEGCWIEGAQVLMYLTAFVEEVTEVTITHASGTKTLYVYNANAGGGGGDPEPEAIDWSTVDFVSGSTQFKVWALLEADRPSVVNIQQPGWSEEQGIYMVFPSDNQLACSLPSAKQGTGLLVYLSNFRGAVETEVTVTWTGGSKTFYVYNNAPMTLPAAKATTPAVATSRVRAVYSQYEYNTGMVMAGWSNGMTKTDVRVDNRRFPAFTFGNYLGLGYGTINVSNMNKIHLDVWTENSFTVDFYLIGTGESSVNLSLTGGQWNSFDLALSDFTPDKSAVKEFKFAGASVANQTIFVDNVYFYADADLPNPDPSEQSDTNFALRTNGSIAYGSTVYGENFPAKSIDGENGTLWETIYDTDPQTFMVDFGQRRIFNIVKIYWGNQYASEFYLETSNNGTDWTEVKHVTGNTTNHANSEQSFELDANATARYIRFRGIVRANGYGYTIKEFSTILAGTPVLTSVDISSDKAITKVGEYATLTVAPKDQNESAIAAELSYTVSPADAGHVTEGKYYPKKYAYATITVTAEAGGEQVSNSVQVWGVVSDNLALNNALDGVGTWYNTDTPAKAVDGIDNDAQNVWQGSTTNGNINDSKIYDAWCVIDLKGNYNLQLIRIHFEGACSDAYKLYGSINNEDWTELYSYAYPSPGDGNRIYAHTDWLSTADLNNADNVRYLKFKSTRSATHWGMKIYEMEVYGSEASTTKSVSATVTPVGSGSVTITAGGDPVTEVESGTEVTFTATSNSGYDFVNWTQGGVEVSTSATYVTTITANTALVANFETHRSEYCSTLISDAGHSSELYVSITNPSENTYKILVEGTSSQKIESAYNNFNFALTHINGESGTTNLPAASWTVDNSGYGSAYVTFTSTDFRDITFVNKYITLNKQGGEGLLIFDAFPNADLIKWDATCADNLAPDLANPTAESIGSSKVRLTLSATDDVAAVLTYHINYKPTGDEGEGENVDVVGASGETVHKVITGLTTSVEYTFTVTVSDAKPNTSAAKVCTATPTMPTAPVPTRDATYVRSIYSDAFESVIVSNYVKNSYTGIEYSELNINDDHFILYDYSTQKEIVWGADNENSDAMLAAEGYTYGTKKGLDVRGMNYIHFDVYSTTATTYPNLYVQNVRFPFSVDDSGWQSFDINISNLDETVAQSITMLKFNDFRTPKPDEIAIDNVYFYAVPANISFGDDAMDNTTTIEANANKFANVTINRNILADDTWYTLCLPFDMSAEKVNEVFGASTIATLVSSEDRGSLIHLNFDYVDAIEAGKPYLIKPGTSFAAGTTISNVTIKNVDPSAEGYKAEATHMHFQGTFDKIMLEGADKRYVSANNELYSPNPNGGSAIGAFRCYFTIPDGSSASAPGKQARIVFGPQQATGIDLINDSSKSNGKLLINGVLYIIRDGNTYNAQGMLVE